MKFFHIVFPLIALCIGLVVWQETASPSKEAEARPENAPGVDTPSAGNLISALGIALGTGGGMRTVGGPDDPRLVTDPLTTRKPVFYGWDVNHPGMAGAGDDVHLVQSALADAPMRPGIERPGAIRTLAAAPGCTPPPVEDGQKLTKVHVFDGQLPTGYHAMSDADLASNTAAYLSRLQRATPGDREAPSAKSKPVNMVNVVLTDESAPLYLVLQSSSNRVVWNLHATLGVKIAQIVLVGHPGQAVSQISDTTPVTMLNIGADCAPQPWRDVAIHWDRHPNRQADLTDSSRGAGGGTFREGAANYYSRYNTWFEATFGEPAEPGTVGAWTATHVLAGPMPASAEARPWYRPLDGATIVAHEGPILYISPKAEREADIVRRSHDLARLAAGGDLSIVNPDPMERAQ